MDKEVMVKKDILHKYFEQLFFLSSFSVYREIRDMHYTYSRDREVEREERESQRFLWRKFVIFHIKIKLFFGEKFCNRIKAKEMCKSHSLFNFMQREWWICTF